MKSTPCSAVFVEHAGGRKVCPHVSPGTVLLSPDAAMLVEERRLGLLPRSSVSTQTDLGARLDKSSSCKVLELAVKPSVN